MNTCPKCGAEFSRTVRICPNDGTVLEEKSTVDPRVGTTLDGKYRLDSALGQGGMGTIYRATHLMLDKPVAVKLIKGDLVTSADVVRRFQREARAASNLNHPNIAAAYDLGQTQDGTLYIAMELVNGPSLKDVIRSTGPLDPARIVRILRQVGSALSAAHKHGIIHRDLKPHNIMLASAPGDGEVAKLLDFGIAKTFDDAATQLTATGFVLGTPQYMSPEQAAGRQIDGRSDLYSLGIILFEMLVGEVPFNDPSTPALLVKHLTEPAPAPSRRRPDLAIPPALEAVALRCLEKDPAARFQSADEFAAALEIAVGQIGGRALPTELAPTVVVTPPAPTAPAPAAGQPSTSPLPPTVIAPVSQPAQKTGQVYSPAAPSIPPTATSQPAASSIPPTAPAVAAAPPMPAPSAPPPASLSAAAAPGPATPAGSPLSRNLIVVGAVVVLLLAGAAYFAMSGGGGVGDANVSSSASMPPPAAQPPQPTAAPSPPPPDTGSSAPGAPPAGTSSSGVSTPTGSATGSARGAQPQAQQGGTSAAPREVSPPPTASPQSNPSGGGAPAAAAQPANPAVAFRCSGASNVCASLRGAIGPAFESSSIVSVQDPGKADILVEARVEVVSERTETMFGTTFVTRTYSVELTGESRGTGQAVPMPAATTFSFDARVGQERLDGQTRLIASSAAEKLRAFWKSREAQPFSHSPTQPLSPFE